MAYNHNIGFGNYTTYAAHACHTVSVSTQYSHTFCILAHCYTIVVSMTASLVEHSVRWTLLHLMWYCTCSAVCWHVLKRLLIDS